MAISGPHLAGDTGEQKAGRRPPETELNATGSFTAGPRVPGLQMTSPPDDGGGGRCSEFSSSLRAGLRWGLHVHGAHPVLSFM